MREGENITKNVGVQQAIGPSDYQTFGQQRVRSGFNPSGNETMDYIKATTAHLIDYVQAWCKDKDPRLAALAQTAYEEAAMWAVKAATEEAERCTA